MQDVPHTPGNSSLQLTICFYQDVWMAWFFTVYLYHTTISAVLQPYNWVVWAAFLASNKSVHKIFCVWFLKKNFLLFVFPGSNCCTWKWKYKPCKVQDTRVVHAVKKGIFWPLVSLNGHRLEHNCKVIFSGIRCATWALLYDVLLNIVIVAMGGSMYMKCLFCIF